jgi:hypothetical protein
MFPPTTQQLIEFYRAVEMEPFVVVDVKTTGCDSRRHRVTEVATRSHRANRLSLLKPTGIFLALLLSLPLPGVACPDYKFEIASRFPSPLTEASGLVRGSGNFWWSHNDSGDGPFLYAIDPKGKLLGKVEVQGARNIDWEDLTAGPCLGALSKERCLYIGDIGDNSSWRDDAVIYVVREPTPKSQKVDLLETLPVHYPNHPANSEAFVYDVQGKQFLIFTKYKKGKVIAWWDKRISENLKFLPNILRNYLFIQQQKEGLGRVYIRSLKKTEPLLRKIAEMDISKLNNNPSGWSITGAALSKDGKTLLVRTYLSAYRWFRDPSESWSKVLTRVPAIIPLQPEPQGEAIAFGPKDQDFYTTSEKVPNLAHYSCQK